jgi:hypothetical protein
MNTRRRLLSSIAAFLILLAAIAVPTAAQGGRGQGDGAGGTAGQRGRAGGTPPPAGSIPRGPDGKPDLTGTWNGGSALSHTVILEEHPGGFGVTAGKGLIIDPPNGIIPYQPWALAERNRRREDANGYEDPVGHCEFYDIGRMHSFAQEIMYSGNTVIINANQHITRVVDMTRREHLPPGIRLWNGDPIGRWEGDTLVVDSTNFNGKTRMAIGGDFYSPDAHIVERYAPVDANTLKWTMTIDDPKVFTRPWTMTTAVPMARVGALGARNFDGEDTCHEGNVDLVHLKNVYDQAHGNASQAK